MEFSVDKVRLVNDGREQHKATFYVQNRCSASRKIRVAVDKRSDPVSVWICMTNTLLTFMPCHAQPCPVHPARKLILDYGMHNVL